MAEVSSPLRATRTRHFFRSLFTVRLPPGDVRLAVLAACAFNVVGMTLELVMLRHSNELPLWPEGTSILVGTAILLSLNSKAIQVSSVWMQSLFLLNAGAVSFALYLIYSFGARAAEYSIAFQATKLGALVAAMLAPGFLVGLAAIGIHIGAAVIQFSGFPPEVQALSPWEPWPMVAFGVAGVFILSHRLHLRGLHLETLEARAEAQAVYRLAVEFLELRDLMNTPLQTIEIGVSLLRKQEPEIDRQEVIETLQRSVARLHEISRELRRYEHALEWKDGRGGLGDRAAPAERR